MMVLAGGDIVLPDRVITGGSLVVEHDRIVGIEARHIDSAGAEVRSVAGLTILPGFIDVHVHGVAGTDLLDGPDAVARVAARLPRHGVTAFCPTSVACTPESLRVFLAAVAAARATPAAGAARVLGAHLESNFLNPEWSGAQPANCLRTYGVVPGAPPAAGAFTGDDILGVIHAHHGEVGIVTVAPELAGGLDLVRLLRGRGHIVSIGHTGATYAEAREAIAAGVTHATHLFNRMSPMAHRAPGVVGAVLESPEVAAEIICDGHHVHPSVVSLALRTKNAERVMAITDGTAASGLPLGARAALGGRPIVVTPRAAQLEDGTLAGSVITMDHAFRMLVHEAGVPIGQAARVCATTPAERLGLPGQGRIAIGALADLVVVGPALDVVQTWVGGRLVSEH